MPMYTWCGLWTSLILVVLASFNAPSLIRYCTRFTEDVFNSLLGLNFIAEGAVPLVCLLLPALVSGMAGPTADALLAINTAILTSIACRKFNGATRARYFTARARSLVADFGPAITIVAMSALLSATPFGKLGNIARLELGESPASFGLHLVNLADLSVPYRFLAAIPAVFLAMLFFLDHNISVRTVNSPSNKLVKGEAYNLDLFALGLITGFSSLFGLPWMCSATVQSLNHVRALSTYRDIADDTPGAYPAAGALVAPLKPLEKPASAAADKATPRPRPPLPSPDAIIIAANANRTPGPRRVAASPDGAVPVGATRAAAVVSEDTTKVATPRLSNLSAVQTRNGTTLAKLSNVSFAATLVNTSNTAGSNGAAAKSKNETSQTQQQSPTPVLKAGGGASAVALLETRKKELNSGGAVGLASGLKILAGAGSGATASDVSSVVETRVTGFTVHLLVLCSLAAAPVLSQVPLAVVWVRAIVRSSR